MNLTELTHQTNYLIYEFVHDSKPFTALDITNELRSLFPNECIKYGDVRAIVTNFPITPNSYMVSVITVTTADGKNIDAKLYHSTDDLFDLYTVYDDNARKLKPLHTLAVPANNVVDTDVVDTDVVDTDVVDTDVVDTDIVDTSANFDPEAYWETISQSYSF